MASLPINTKHCKQFRLSIITVLVTGLLACGGGGGGGSTSTPTPTPTPNPTPTPPPSPTPDPGTISFSNATSSLPDGLDGRCMDGEATDVDGDGDLDLILAIEIEPNILLTNNGNAGFTLSRIFADRDHDSEDMTVADFDGDGDDDVLFVTEDDQINEFYLSQGNGSFTDVSDRIPVDGISNAVALLDADNNGTMDVIVGNGGANNLLLNDGSAQFTDVTDTVPMGRGITQDIEVGDVDGDGDLDVFIGNENLNALFINNGDGTFTDETQTRLPNRSAETRDIEMGDIDGDGDLDVLVSNVAFFGSFSDDNYLLINDGTGVFSEGELPTMSGQHVDSDFVDLDRDGDLDIITSTANLTGDIGSASAYLNDGTGTFTVAGFGASGNTFDIIAADFNGDSRLDLYFCNREAAFTTVGFEGGQDQLFLAD